MGLNLFPVRAAIGRVNVNGQDFDVLMTVEFSRALAALLDRVGGPDGTSTAALEDQIIDLTGRSVAAAFDTAPAAPPRTPDTVPADQSAQVAALMQQVSSLRVQVEAFQQGDALRKEVEQLRIALGMIEDPAAAVRFLQKKKQNRITPGNATGSRGANAALASLLTALAASGLVIDSTTP